MHAFLKWIESQDHRLLNYVKKWANVNSYSHNLAGLATLAKMLKEDFFLLGGELNGIYLPSYSVIDSKGMPIEIPLGQALSFSKRPHAPVQVFLSGHMDTVFPPSSAFQTVEEIAPSICRGPGVVDMKGGLAILLIALEALERSSFAQQIGWQVLITPDEEIGSPGSAFLFTEAAKKYHLGLVFEPAYPDGAFVSQRKGSANYTVVVRGRAAHAGRDFDQGRSAIFALAAFIKEIENQQTKNSGKLINIGHIEGGGPINIVPDLAMARLNIRSSDEQVIQTSLADLENIAAIIRKREGINVEIFSQTIRFPKKLDPATNYLFNCYAECARHLNIPFALRESGGVCDGNLLAQAGLPTLDSLGAVGGNMHTEREYLLIPSLIERAKLAALFLLQLASSNITLNPEFFHA